MADVARLAGVSVSTVSYALSGTRPISVSTRERIEQAMLDLGYTPNAFARGLKSKRSRIIALLLPTETGNLRLSALEHILGASDRVQERGYHLMLWTTGAEAIDDLTQLAGQGLVDGALVMDVRPDDPRIQVLAGTEMPFTVIGGNAGTAGLDYTETDFDQSAALAVDHLAEQGHQRLGFVSETGEDEAAGGGEGARLEDALQRAAGRAGVRLVVESTQASVAGGRRAFDRLIKNDPQLSAIIAFSDHALPGLLRAAHDLGRRIPQDLSMMCIDMPPHVAELTDPPMTTVGVSAADIGQAAVDLLLRRLDGDSAPARQLLFRGELNRRGSCGPAPAADQLFSNSEAGQRRHLQ